MVSTASYYLNLGICFETFGQSICLVVRNGDKHQIEYLKGSDAPNMKNLITEITDIYYNVTDQLSRMGKRNLKKLVYLNVFLENGKDHILKTDVENIFRTNQFDYFYIHWITDVLKIKQSVPDRLSTLYSVINEDRLTYDSKIDILKTQKQLKEVLQNNRKIVEIIALATAVGEAEYEKLKNPSNDINEMNRIMNNVFESLNNPDFI